MISPRAQANPKSWCGNRAFGADGRVHGEHNSHLEDDGAGSKVAL
jgi:hypothetical protein